MFKSKVKNEKSSVEFRGVEKSIVVEIIYFVFIRISSTAHLFFFGKGNGLKDGLLARFLHVWVDSVDVVQP